MNTRTLAGIALLAVLSPATMAQYPPVPYGTPYSTPYSTPYGTPYGTPSGVPYVAPYGTSTGAPYGYGQQACPAPEHVEPVPADHGKAGCGPHFWFSTEYLYWKMKDAP